MAKRERFHPQSPVQADRTSPIPLIIAGLLLVAVAWQTRDSWIDALAPPYVETVEQPPRAGPNSARPQSARGNLVGLFSADDYPVEALRKNEQGTVVARLQIDRKGRVSDCTLLQSSGSRALDMATCDILSRRARFTPARNSDGHAVPDTYDQRVMWRLP